MGTYWTNPCIADGISAGWLLDEPSGNFADFSGNGNTLTAVTVGAYQQRGLLARENEYSAYFAGSGFAYFHDTALPAGGATMECWVNSAVNDGGIIEHGDTNIFEIRAQGGTYVAKLVTAAGIKTADSGVAVGTPAHVVATYDGTNLKIYVGGVLKATTAAGAPFYNGQDTYFRVAISNGGPALAGYISKVGIYRSVLTANQIAMHHAIGAYVFNVRRRQPFDGNTNLARRYRDSGTNGNAMTALLIADSIGVNLVGSLQRSLKPGKWTNFIGTTSVSTPEANLGIGLSTYPNAAGTASYPDNAHTTFTGNGVAAPDGGSIGDAGCMALRVDCQTPAAWSQQMHAGDFIWEALSRGVQPVVDALIKRTASGDDASYFYAYVADNVQNLRTPGSGFLTCSGSGYSKVSLTMPLTAPVIAPSGNQFGFRLPNAQASVNAKTITVGNHFRVSTGEAGFGFGSLAVGGTTLVQWSAADGIVPDAYISALVSNYGISDFWVMLGANDGDLTITNYQTLFARLRGLCPGCGIILISTYELRNEYGGSRQAAQEAAARAAAVADGNCLYLDLYHAFGPWQMNYANTGSGSAFYDNFGIGDGVHPADIGRRGLGELIDSLLQMAALLPTLSAPNTITGVAVTRDISGNIRPNTPVMFRMLVGPGVGGNAVNGMDQVFTSDWSGNLYAQLVQGATYKMWSGQTGSSVNVTVPTSGTSFTLPEIVLRI